ncbi:nucleoside diphosphate kinase [Sulfurivirga caldicuralii]|uniref:Nucleoside diphosphate kinase n=1 Tax=Sulfurivirga caldicuralii TaxID=364032 RepID=A0A1N6G7M1_9GAMM|nr:nucleoside-diphosphate kinase [Sulfurivirga caldicuralii]SIO03525.1 nucleoside diphosphate kinase [Sulfurivirga caldicuralii]
MYQQTFAIIKPDAVERNLIGQIVSRIEAAGLEVCAMKMVHMSRREASGFYAEHEGKPFWETLLGNMTAGPSVVMVLSGEDAIQRWRELMGPTDPAKGKPGQLRRDFAVSMERNSVHGSDSPESAAREIAWFFAGVELHYREH